jgi:hypothetical protein
MPLVNDAMDWFDNAEITVNVELVKRATAKYKHTSEGDVAVFEIEMKPGAVPWPDGLDTVDIDLKLT